MSTRLFTVVFDAADPISLAHWWREALDWDVLYEAPDEVVIIPPGIGLADGIPGLVFVPVDDPKRGKNRVHLDLASGSTADQAAMVERLVGSGATLADIGQHDVPWTVLADPEGNELCVLEPRDRYQAGALAAIVVDSSDPHRAGEFWAAATGRHVGHEDADGVSLRHPDDRLPDLEFLRNADPRTGKNRLHLDVAPWPDDDQEAEAARLMALGARPADVGQGDGDEITWVVLADPEGNEFCVLRPR